MAWERMERKTSSGSQTLKMCETRMNIEESVLNGSRTILHLQPSRFIRSKTIVGNMPMHTCQLSVFRTESPSFSSRQNLRPRRRKSQSFEHRLFSVSGHHFVFSSYNPNEYIIQKTAMASRRSGSPCARNSRKTKAHNAHFNPD